MIIVSIGYNTALGEFIESNFMPRQNISLTEKNDLWLRNQIDYVGEYANKSELVNDLIIRARRAEIKEFTEQSPQEILAEFKLLLLHVNTSHLTDIH